MAMAAGTQAVEMRVVDVRRRSATEDQPGEHVIVLKEVSGTRQLFIWVGPFECEAMALQLEKVEYSRPLTFTFMAKLMRATGATLREVRITKLEKTVIYASAIVEGSAGTRTVDARPSDALTLAVITGAPIWVEPAVLDAADTTQTAHLSIKGIAHTLRLVSTGQAELSERRGRGACPLPFTLPIPKSSASAAR
jgi:bifunctional DNase/RNase